MGKITDIAKQKHNDSRVSVFIDGEFALGLDAVTALAARIKIGDEITAEELKAVAHVSEVNSAFERAVGYVSYAPRSKRETEKYLRDKGYDGDVVSEAVKRLCDYKYIDDLTYAQSYVKSKSGKYGKIRIRSELKRKGISADIIDDILSGEEFCDDYTEEEYDERSGAAEVARRYLKSHRGCDAQKLKRYLAGRGFTWDCINAVVRDAAESGAFSDDDTDTDYE